MKRNGFTLIEILGVILVLIIISLIALYGYKNINNKINKKNYDNLISYIENAAVQFASDNSVQGVITLQDLIDNGYVTPDDKSYIYSPIDKKNLSCNKIIITYDENKDAYVSSFTNDTQELDEDNKCNADFVQVYEINSFTSTQNLGVLGNVILVLDISGSMGDPISSNEDIIRLTATKDVINSLTQKILLNNDLTTNNTKIALVTFADNAQIAQSPTTDYNTFKNTVNNLEAFGGTNWEAALQKTNSVDFGNDNNDYVIFISDGNPTFRLTKEPINPSYISPKTAFNYGTVMTDEQLDTRQYEIYNAYGSGYEQADDNGNTEHADANIQRCYNHAIDDAQAIVNSGKELYTIFAYGEDSGAQNMKNLTISSGSLESHYYNASNAEELYNALITIFQEDIINEGSATTYLSQDGTIFFESINISEDNPLIVYNGSTEYKKYIKEDNKYLIKDNNNYIFKIKSFAKDNHLSIKKLTVKYYN